VQGVLAVPAGLGLEEILMVEQVLMAVPVLPVAVAAVVGLVELQVLVLSGAQEPPELLLVQAVGQAQQAVMEVRRAVEQEDLQAAVMEETVLHGRIRSIVQQAVQAAVAVVEMGPRRAQEQRVVCLEIMVQAAVAEEEETMLLPEGPEKMVNKGSLW
jgi:hypothetical protein